MCLFALSRNSEEPSNTCAWRDATRCMGGRAVACVELHEGFRHYEAYMHGRNLSTHSHCCASMNRTKTNERSEYSPEGLETENGMISVSDSLFLYWAVSWPGHPCLNRLQHRRTYIQSGYIHSVVPPSHHFVVTLLIHYDLPNKIERRSRQSVQYRSAVNQAYGTNFSSPS